MCLTDGYYREIFSRVINSARESTWALLARVVISLKSNIAFSILIASFTQTASVADNVTLLRLLLHFLHAPKLFYI